MGIASEVRLQYTSGTAVFSTVLKKISWPLKFNGKNLALDINLMRVLYFHNKPLKHTVQFLLRAKNNFKQMK